MKKSLVFLGSLLSIGALAGCNQTTPHEHTFKTEFAHDETNHWHEASCEHTDFISGLKAHNFGGDNVCDDCGYIKSSPVTPHEHTFDNNWSNDEFNHWHAATCEHSDLTKNLAKHVDDDENGKCDFCDYVFPVAPKTVYSFKFVGFNCSLNNQNSYTEGTSVDLTFTVDAGYHLEEIITVLGNDSYEYSAESKTLSLEVNDNITVVAHALQDVEEETPDYGDAFYKLSADFVNYKAEEHQGEYDIASHALVIGNQCWQTYLVYDGLEEECEEKGIEVWMNQSDAEAKNKPDYKCEYHDLTKRNDERYDEYFLKDLSFVNLVDILYARTYFIKDGVKTYSEIDEWSMLESCHEFYNSGQMLEFGNEPAKYVLYGYELIRSIVDYASKLQTYFEYKADHLAKDEIYKYGLAHTDTYDGERIIFSSPEEVSVFFSNIDNCFGDLELVFDMPCTVPAIHVANDWDHQIHFNSKSLEVEIGTVESGQKHSTLQIENLTVNEVVAINTVLVARNSLLRNIHSGRESVELFDSHISFFTANGAPTCHFHSCTITRMDTYDIVNFDDCGDVTFTNCKMENVELFIRDTWDDDNPLICTFTIEGDMTRIIDTEFRINLTKGTSSATIMDGIYAENTVFNSSGILIYLCDGYYNTCTLSNVLVSGGYFTNNPRQTGVGIKAGYKIETGEYILTSGIYDYRVVSEGN